MVSRIDGELLDELLASFVDLIDGPLELSIDSTGIELTSASYYYITVLERNEDRIKKGKKKVRHHIKMTMALETRCQIVVSVRFRYGPDNDFGDAIPTLAAASVRSVAVVVGDKGYDSQEIRRFIWYDLRAEAHIPLREWRKHGGRTTSIYRKKQMAEFDIGRYHRRPLSETANSVIKRTMRNDVLARSSAHQFKELRLRAIAYNVRREGKIMDDVY